MDEGGFEVADKICAQDGCEASYKAHYWGAVKAHDVGWFLQKNGDSWCPDHNPPWVAEWRERRAGLTRDQETASKPFPSKFDSVCGNKDKISEGDDIVMWNGKAWHVDCYNQALGEQWMGDSPEWTLS